MYMKRSRTMATITVEKKARVLAVFLCEKYMMEIYDAYKDQSQHSG
jgi:hypothetical protein